MLEYIGTVQQDESSTIKETSGDVAMYSLSSSGSDSYIDLDKEERMLLLTSN